MKVVLISTDDGIAAVGVRVLSSCLIKHGFNTAIVLMPSSRKGYKNFFWNDLKKICENAGLIAVSCFSHSVSKAIRVNEELRKIISVPIIIGGIHSCFEPDSLIQNFNLVCCGEGEDLIVELANRLNNGKSYQDIPGLWIKEKNGIIKNPSMPLKNNLNDYPLPDYDLSHQFILEGNRLVPMRRSLSHLALDGFVITASRGCSQRCAYCSNNKIGDIFPWRNKVRSYSVDYFINHFKELCRFYPEIKSFWIGDDDFFDKEIVYLKEFCERYKKEVNKPFLVLMHPRTFSEEKFELLSDAGMYRLIMGIQSGSERINRDIYNRNFPVSKIIEVARCLSKYSSVDLCYDFIVMNPFEEEKDLIESIQLIKKLPAPFRVSNNKLAFYPGTSLFAKANNLGIDISRRNKHAGPDIGYRILKEENIQHKLLHFILLKMCGKVNRWRIGMVPRFLISDNFIDFYSFLNKKLTVPTNTFVALVGALLFFHVRLKNYFKYPFLKAYYFIDKHKTGTR